MFELHLKTIFFSNFIFVLFLTLTLGYAYFRKMYKYSALRNWFIAFLFFSIHFLALLLTDFMRTLFNNENITKLIFTLLFALYILAFFEIKRGLIKFYDIKNKTYRLFMIEMAYIDLIIFFSVLIIFFCFRFNLKIVAVILSLIPLAEILDVIHLISKNKETKANKKNLYNLLFILTALGFARIFFSLKANTTFYFSGFKNPESIMSILFSLSLLTIYLGIAAIIFEAIISERDDLIQKIKKIAITDSLTGLLNRRGFYNLAEYELSRISRNATGFSIAIGDIDYFKNANDEFGHHNGDIILIEIAKILKQNIRKVDILARWGGEEFVILFPATGICEAAVVLERIRIKIENAEFLFDGRKTYKTISFGLSFCNNCHETLDKVISYADKNLYKAKETGRNKIISTSFSLIKS